MGDTDPQAPGLHAALTCNTGYLISRLGHYAARHFADHIASVGLTPPMWGALNVLAADAGITQQQLGRSIGMDPSSIVATVDELETRGLAQRRAHPGDRRAHALYVTEAGRETLAQGRRLARCAHDELLAPLDETERAQLHELLARLVQAAAVNSGAPPEAHAFMTQRPPRRSAPQRD